MRLSPPGQPTRKFLRMAALPLLLTALPALAQIPQPDAPAAGASVLPPPSMKGAPASASTSGEVSLDDIRNFTRVYQIVKQAYVEKVDDKTIMKAAIAFRSISCGGQAYASRSKGSSR